MRDWLLALGEQSAIGVVLLDDSRIVFVNDAMARLMGVPAERLVGLDLCDAGSFLDRERFVAVQEWLRRRDAARALTAVAAGAAGMLAIERLLQDQTFQENTDGQEET